MEPLWLLIFLGTAFRLWAAGTMGLGYGESYYFSCARHIDLSYFDHPPLSIWITTLSMHLAGTIGPFTLRLPSIIMFAGTTWLMFLLGRKIFGHWPGFYAALLLNLAPVFSLATGGWLVPDAPLMFFFLAGALCLSHILFENPKRSMRWWIWVGIILGFALLSKYHAVFLVLGTFMFLLTQKRQRRWLKKSGPYVAILIAGTLFLPVLIWNARHEWISFLWQGARGTAWSGLHFDWLARSIGGQALWLVPWIWLPLLWELWRSFVRGRSEKQLFLGWLAIGPILIFTAASLYAPFGFHFHWQAPGYLMLFPALGNTVHRTLQSSGHKASWVRWWLRISCAFIVVAVIIFVTHASTGWWHTSEVLSSTFVKEEDQTLELLDYTPLEQALTERGFLDSSNVFVFTNRWFLSGKVDYALRGKARVYCFNAGDPRGFAFFSRMEDILRQDGILVSTTKFLTEPEHEYGPYFETITYLGDVPVPRGNNAGVLLKLYFCKNLKAVFPMPYK